MDTRSQIQYERELHRRLARYKTPRKATIEEVEERIERFRKIGTPVFVNAADLMEKYLDDGTWAKHVVTGKP